jgi:hypothetical protein
MSNSNKRFRIPFTDYSILADGRNNSGRVHEMHGNHAAKEGQGRDYGDA